MIKVGINIGMEALKRVLLLCLFSVLVMSIRTLEAKNLSSNEKSSTVEAEKIEDMSTEEEKISFLIKATESTLDNLKKVKTALEQFKQQEKICLSKNSSKKEASDALFELSRRAYVLVSLIRELELSHYFRKDFIDELDMVSRAYRVKSLPSARMEAE